jgi:hypothetical protein
MERNFHYSSIKKLSELMEKVTHFFNKINPITAFLIILFGIGMIFCGVFFLHFPPTQSLSAGIGTFALGLALVSFGMNQYKGSKSDSTIQEINTRLIRIEETLDKMDKCD